MTMCFHCSLHTLNNIVSTPRDCSVSEAGSLSTEADGSRTSPPSPGRGAAEAELERVAAAERRDRGVTGRSGDTRGRGVKCR